MQKTDSRNTETKKPYSKPELIRLGDMAASTMGMNGSSIDGNGTLTQMGGGMSMM